MPYKKVNPNGPAPVKIMREDRERYKLLYAHAPYAGVKAKSRPILFSAEMVRALLAGLKSQTRRAIKPQPTVDQGWEGEPGWALDWDKAPDDAGSLTPEELALLSPYGKPGDTLWVRETCQIYGFWAVAGKTPTGKTKLRFVEHHDKLVEYANDKQQEAERNGTTGWVTRPSILMPRWASRILLEVVSVRVELLNEITEADALAEGCKGVQADGVSIGFYRYFKPLWESINGKGSWGKNPWVFVVEFKIIEVKA